MDVETFARDGFVELPGLFAPHEVAQLLAEIEAVRSPEERNELSAGAMTFTSNVYRRSSAVRALLTDDRIVAIVTALLGPSAWCRWDQAVCKGPGSDTFPWHQDNGYTRLAHEHLQVWIALTDAPADRGGLLVEPGGHRRVRDHRWVGNHVEVVDPPAATTAIRARAGDVIAFSSLLPHATGPNRTEHDRWAYVAEFLPLDVDDPSVDPPHLVVASDGRAVAPPSLP